jgi:uncharacterized delta-60 repeat protein
MLKLHLLFVICICTICTLSTNLFAQVDTAWTRIYNGPSDNIDIANSLAIDGQGNVYVAGESDGIGTGPDYLTIKNNASGDTIWTRRYCGPVNSSDHANAIAVDLLGNVYVTGGSDNDFVTIKYNSNGEILWFNRYDGPANLGDAASHIALDNSGNVYVAGTSYATGVNFDYATIKYNSAGTEQWAQRYDGPGNSGDNLRDLKVDVQGNIYITGYSMGVGTAEDCATIKYNTNGDTVWVRRYCRPGFVSDVANALTLDTQGNVYVTGSGGGFVTIKYNSIGDTGWVRHYNRPGTTSNFSYGLAVDADGNVYVTGQTVSSDNSEDYTTVKYNSLGDTVWTRIYYCQPGSFDDCASDIALDNSGNVYVTGYSAENYIYGWATLKYSPAGVQQWAIRYDGPGSGDDCPCDLVLDEQGNVYVTGYTRRTFSNTTTDYATVKYVQTGAIEENEIGVANSNCAKTSGVEIFPNPAKNYFTIRLPQTLKQVQGDNCVIKIFDVTGKIVQRISGLGVGDWRISLDGIKNGIYFVKADNINQVTKLIVTK